jgi:kynurenine formamidase
MRPTILLALALLAAAAAPVADHHLTKADIDRWMTELSNWGRWGKDDQIGTVNLITDAKRKQAAALVREGVSISMARESEITPAADNSSPFGHKMIWTGKNTPGQFSLDEYTVNYHGYAHTHMDALCHMFFQGKMYNGFSQDTVTDKGASRNAITNFKNGILSRGILIDIPLLKGVPYLEPSTPVYPEDLEAWEKKAGVKIGSGDIVFLRTGRWARRAVKGPWDASAHSAGFYASCAKWLKNRDVAMVGSDAASDVMPSMVEGVAQPIHQLFLIAMGTAIFDNCDLEALSKAAAQRNRWEFMLTAAPIPVTGGTGSPLNPIATF